VQVGDAEKESLAPKLWALTVSSRYVSLWINHDLPKRQQNIKIATLTWQEGWDVGRFTQWSTICVHEYIRKRERRRERRSGIRLMGFISHFRYNRGSIRLQLRCKNVQPWPPGGTISRLMFPRVSDGHGDFPRFRFDGSWGSTRSYTVEENRGYSYVKATRISLFSASDALKGNPPSRTVEIREAGTLCVCHVYLFFRRYIHKAYCVPL